ncbi:nuclear pore complex protein Nup54, partial [Tremellales sp. Uapishka_1]
MAGFSFGAATQPQAQPQTSLFGASSTAPKPAFGGFSTPQPQQSSGSSLFGAAPQPPTNPAASSTTGGLFGSANTNAGAQPASGGLFGAAPAPAPAAGGLFGASTTNTPAGGLFGSTAQPASTGGGLFGSTAQPSGGGLFGSTQQASTPTGGLFGSTQSQPPAQAGGLFGAQNQNQTTGAGGLFGSTNNAQTQNQTQNQGSSLFGNNNKNAGGGLFGQSQSQQPQQQQQSSLFGSVQQPQSSGLFNSTAQSQSQPQFQGSTNTRQEPDIESRMLAVQKAWSNESPDCRFKYLFYNVVENPQQYGKPPNVDDARWAKAQRENPDPSCMVPVLATGWADVKKRIQMQEQLASVHQQRVKELQQALSNLTTQTSLSSSLRLAALQSHLTQLLHRLLHLAALTPQFIPLLQSTAFRPEEVEVKQQLEGVKAELDGRGKQVVKAGFGLNARGHGAAGKGRMIGQVNELWGQVEEIRRRRKREGGREGWLNDERALGEVADILATQQLALQKLTDLVTNGLFDAEVMKSGLGAITGREER